MLKPMINALQQAEKVKPLNITEACLRVSEYINTRKLDGKCYSIRDSITIELSKEDWEIHEEMLLNIINYGKD